jgi:phage-related holin
LHQKGKGSGCLEDWQMFIHFIRRIPEFPIVKVAVGIFLWLLHLFWGDSFRPVYVGVGLLWFADTATGLYYAWINTSIKPESRRMWHGLFKLAIYALLLGVGHQLNLIAITAFIQGSIEGFIMLTESYSVMENLHKIGEYRQWKVLPTIEWVMSILQGNLNAIKAIPVVNPWSSNQQQPKKTTQTAQVNTPPEGDA